MVNVYESTCANAKYNACIMILFELSFNAHSRRFIFPGTRMDQSRQFHNAYVELTFVLFTHIPQFALCDSGGLNCSSRIK